MNRKANSQKGDGLVPGGLLEILAWQAKVLEETVEVLQQVQARLPIPSPEEVEEIRSRVRPMSRAAYLLARLQGHLVAIENVASDLRTDLEHGFDPEGVYMVETLFNALASAVQDRKGLTSSEP